MLKQNSNLVTAVESSLTAQIGTTTIIKIFVLSADIYIMDEWCLIT